MQQLKAWFTNNTLPVRKAVAAPAFIVGNPHKSRRRLKAVEIYSRHYYESRVREGVKKEIKDRGFTGKQLLAVVKRRTRKAFDDEDEDTREEIYKILEANKLIELDTPDDGKPTPESMDRYVRNPHSILISLSISL